MSDLLVNLLNSQHRTIQGKEEAIMTDDPKLQNRDKTFSRRNIILRTVRVLKNAALLKYVK